MRQCEDQTPTEAERDRALLANVTAGSREALGQLYDRFAPRMLALALRILGTRRDAEDLLHDVFLEVWRRAADYDPDRGEVATWLLLRVRSRAIDRLRLSGARLQSAEVVESLVGPGRDNPALEPERAQLRRALERLPESQAEALIYAYYGGLTCREIAERQGVPLGTVKSRLAAAMARLRLELEP